MDVRWIDVLDGWMDEEWVYRAIRIPGSKQFQLRLKIFMILDHS